jgi:hypothetical protein
MTKLLLTLATVATTALATPAAATVEVTNGSNVGCASGPLAPSADKCAGYYDKNQFSGQTGNVALQQSAVDLLLGAGKYTVDWDQLDKDGKIVSGSNIDAFNKLMANAGGQVLIGLHWGNVPGDVQNVSAFYLWDNVATGSIRLTDTQGYSNAVLYRSTSVAAVPEPGTWALMLVGFGAVGGAMRRRRREALIPQFA